MLFGSYVMCCVNQIRRSVKHVKALLKLHKMIAMSLCTRSGLDSAKSSFYFHRSLACLVTDFSKKLFERDVVLQISEKSFDCD